MSVGKRDTERTPGTSSHRTPDAPIPLRPEGEPHLTFETLLEDSLHEIIAHEADALALPDPVTTLCDDAVAALRAAGTGLPASPFHHAYLTPAGTPSLPSQPARLDVRH